MNLERIKTVLRRERYPVFAIVIVLLLLGCFGVLASEVAEAETEVIDHAILRALRDVNGQPLGPKWLQTAMISLSGLGSVAVAVLVVVFTSAFLLLAKRAWQALLVVGCGIGAATLILVIKAYMNRGRPTIVAALASAEGLSFPSGHTLIASAIYPTLGILLSASLRERRLKVFVFVTAALLALLVGFTRIYLGVHYPTDVLGGWALGLAWAIVCGLVYRRLQRKMLVDRAGH